MSEEERGWLDVNVVTGQRTSVTLGGEVQAAVMVVEHWRLMPDEAVEELRAAAVTLAQVCAKHRVGTVYLGTPNLRQQLGDMDAGRWIREFAQEAVRRGEYRALIQRSEEPDENENDQ